MIIRSLRQHWPARKMEWMMSGFMLCWGWYVLLHPELFTDPRTAALFAGLARITSPITDYPALAWGGACFLTGLFRGIALFINGAWTRTPIIRLFAAFVSTFIMTQLILGLWNTGFANTGIVAYPWFIIADLLSMYRAGVDVVHAQKVREAQKESQSVGRSSHRLAA